MPRASFRLDAFTSNPNISEEEFKQAVVEKLLEVEMKLNEDMRFRFHIYEENSKQKKQN